MAKYASWAELERNVPTAYREGATPEAYRGGMNGIAPTGMKVKEGRVTHYGRAVDGKAELVVERYKRAMFEQLASLASEIGRFAVAVAKTDLLKRNQVKSYIKF